MASEAAIEISDDEASCGKQSQQTEADRHNVEADVNAREDNDSLADQVCSQESDNISFHLSDAEEVDIFDSKLKEYEMKRKEMMERLEQESLKPDVDPDADPDADPDLDELLTPPLTESEPTDRSAAKRQAAETTPRRRSKRRAKTTESTPTRRSRRRCADKEIEELDLDLDSLSPAPKLKDSLNSLLSSLKRTPEPDVVLSDSTEPQDDDAVKVGDSDVDSTFTARVQAGTLIIRLPMKPKEKLQRLFDAVAEELSIPSSRVCLGQRDVIYSPHQTPEDVRLGPFDVIEFWEGDSAAAAAAPAGPDPTSVELRVQSAERHSSVTVRLGRTEPMATLMAKYAAERGVKVETLRFRFDGEALEPTETAESLDLEGGECIDVHSC